ncbi:MAG: endonuclease V [Nitrospinota bacterium]
MRFRKLHPWPHTMEEARAIQEELRRALSLRPPGSSFRLVAGADISYPRFGRRAVGGVVVVCLPEFEPVEEQFFEGEMHFPYVPGYLTFREGPILAEAFARLRHRPDVVLFDGQGIAHPRGLGLAAHLGLYLGLPAVGCAKSLLYGKAGEPGPERGSWSPIWGGGGEVIGAALRTRAGVKPLYVSPGHRMDLSTAITLALAASPRYRLPEPLRLAHRRTNEIRRASGVCGP